MAGAWLEFHHARAHELVVMCLRQRYTERNRSTDKIVFYVFKCELRHT